MKKIWLIVLIALVVVIGYGWLTYNSLVTQNEGITSQWAQVETQYQRRFDLIPGLVNSVRGILSQEQEVFSALAEARTRYAGATTVDDKAAAAGQVEAGLGRLLAIMENYPQLRSVEAVQTFMSQLEGTENRISVERKRYNDQVQGYNLIVKRFPGSLVARIAGFGEHAYFEAASGAATAPVVDFES